MQQFMMYCLFFSWRLICVAAYCSFGCSGYVKYWGILWQTLWPCGTSGRRLLLQFFWWLILADGTNLIQNLQAATLPIWYNILKCHCLRMLLYLTHICSLHCNCQRIRIVPPFCTSREPSIGIGFVLFISLLSIYCLQSLCYGLSAIWIPNCSQLFTACSTCNFHL